MTVCGLWKRQGIPCLFKIPTVQQFAETEMPFVYVTLATHVMLATAGYTPCLFRYLTIGLARHNRKHVSQSERRLVKPQRPCTDLCAEPVGVWNRLALTQLTFSASSSFWWCFHLRHTLALSRSSSFPSFWWVALHRCPREFHHPLPSSFSVSKFKKNYLLLINSWHPFHVRKLEQNGWPFCRQHFQINFFERRCLYFYQNSTAICS